jgi:hypothetical protein
MLLARGALARTRDALLGGVNQHAAICQLLQLQTLLRAEVGPLGQLLPDCRAGQHSLEHGQQAAQLARHICLRGAVELGDRLLRDMKA